MKTKRDPAASTEDDWLDAYCWRCGSPDATPHPDGRLLCPPCRRAEFGPPASFGAVSIGPRVYWESHALELCWSCMVSPVDPGDDLGLCSDCLAS